MFKNFCTQKMFFILQVLSRLSDLLNHGECLQPTPYLLNLLKIKLSSTQASCFEGFSALEEMHRKQINDLQQQHQKEVAALLKEKDQQLKEETAATVTGQEKTNTNPTSI